MMTLMGIAGNNHKIDIEGASMKITKIMASDPRRVAEIIVDIFITGKKFTEKRKINPRTGSSYLPCCFESSSFTKANGSF